MPRRRPRLGAALASALLAVACQRGTLVEGELSNGATKGSFQQVSLVRNHGDSLASAIDALCAADREYVQRTNERIQFLKAEQDKFRRRVSQRMPAIQQVALGDSMDKYRTQASNMQRALSERPDTIYQKIMAMVEAATDTQLQATMEGQFRFAKRKPGKYWLYAEWVTDRGANQFLAPVEASDRRKTRQNLDQTTVSKRLHCL